MGFRIVKSPVDNRRSAQLAGELRKDADQTGAPVVVVGKTDKRRLYQLGKVRPGSILRSAEGERFAYVETADPEESQVPE